MIWRRVLFWLSLIAIISAFPIFLILLKRSNELGSKPEYSILQVLEVQNRATPITDRLLVKRRNEYYVVGIPASNGKQWVWVLLNPKYRPFVKELPAESYRITHDQLGSLRRECEVTDPVVKTLEKHLR